MQAEIPAEEPQVDAAHPQLCVPADFQPLPACRHQSFPSNVWGTVGTDLTTSATALRPDGPASSCRKHKLNYLYTT